MGWTIAVVLAVAAGWGIWTFNRLIRLGNRADQAWADIDAQLKRRHDLVPSLVETVKGYAGHERRTLEEVTARRSAARAREGQASTDRISEENRLAGSLRRLFAVAEDYPELRASERFGELQTQLAEIEDALQHARRYYNAVVRDLNTLTEQFPHLLIARPLGFGDRPFFELESPLERRAVKVDLDETSNAAG